MVCSKAGQKTKTKIVFMDVPLAFELYLPLCALTRF